MELYCLKCKRNQVAINLVQIVSKNGKPMVQGVCSVCGGRISRFGKLPETVIVTVEVPSVPKVLCAVGQPIRLGSIAVDESFEVGNRFFRVDSIDKDKVSVTEIEPKVKIVMGTVSLVRKVKEGA